MTSTMIEQTFVSDTIVGSFDDLGILTWLRDRHRQAGDADSRGSSVRQRKASAFTSEHEVHGIEVHVREEYLMGMFHNFYIMTGRERRSDEAEFLELTNVSFAD